MTRPTPAVLRVVGADAPTVTAVEALARAMSGEARLLQDLTGILRAQRSAVDRDDVDAIADSVYATHRVLVTLGEARRRRRSLNELIGGEEDLSLSCLEEVLGDRLSDALCRARDDLRAAARTLAREVEMNRQALREALAAGNDSVRSIYDGPGARRLPAGEPEEYPEARSGTR